MSSAASDFDAELAALRAAVSSGDRSGAAKHLRAIDTALAGISSPVVRGLAYARVQAEIGHADVAVTVLEDLLELIGDDALIYHQLGCHRRQAADAQGALAAFAKACELDPTRLEAWLSLGTLLDERGEPEVAIDCYREALRRDPMDFDVWRNLGNSLAALERFDEAVAAYDSASSRRPDDRTVTLLRAAAHQAKGEIDRANALTPSELQASVGEVVEMLDTSGEPVIACRFRSVPAQREAQERAAAAVLGQVRQELATMDELVHTASRSRWFLVRQGAVVLVCDRDPARPDHPNRFFDASELVLRSVRESRP